jgi:hypothetical protein
MEKERKKYEILKEIYRENENITRFSERGKFAQKEIDLRKAKNDELQRMIDANKTIINSQQKIKNESSSEIENSSEKISRLFDELSNITVISVKEPELIFENKFVYWNNKNNKIHAINKTKKFLEVLWRNKKHRATLEKLEHVVWKHKEKGEKRIEEVKTDKGIVRRVNVGSKFIDPHKIVVLVKSLNEKLDESLFPYKIISVNNHSKKLIGYKLKIRKQPTKKIKKDRKNVADFIGDVFLSPKNEGNN